MTHGYKLEQVFAVLLESADGRSPFLFLEKEVWRIDWSFLLSTACLLCLPLALREAPVAKEA